MEQLRFKDWLIEEEYAGLVAIPNAGHGWDVIYPTTAGEYPRAVSASTTFWWLRWEWRRGQEIGRKLYNIDFKELDSLPYLSVQSNTMPDDTWWSHTEDMGKSNITIHKDSDLNVIGYSGGPDKPMVISNAEKPVPTHGMPDPEGPLPSIDLDHLFGDSPTNSHQDCL